MFDIGFSEMMVVAVVALIVIGPERLPKVARTLGHLFGRMQRYVNDVKSDISREMELEELRKLQATVEDAARAIETSVKTEITTTESALNKVAAEVSASAEPATPAPADVTVAAIGELAEPPATEPAAAVHAPAAAPQLELGLDAAPPAQSVQKQA